jgi:CRISPR-associated RAMP protein (TIGR02581 family)
MSPEPIASFAALHNRLELKGVLVATTALRIGAGRVSHVVGNDLPVLRDAQGAPFIPGASLKGALRAQIEALIRSVAPRQARDLLETEGQMRGEVADLRDAHYIEARRSGTPIHEADRAFSAQLWGRELTTMIDLTFGAPWIAGRLAIKDALVDSSIWFGQFEVRNGVALNRDTETAEDGLLYDYEVVPVGTRFAFELVLENAEPWQLGMLLIALQPWEAGRAQIGGFRTRGLGYVQLTDLKRRYIEINGVDDLLRMICNDETLAALEIAPAAAEIDSATRNAWYQAFHAELTQAAKEEAGNA